MSNNIKTGVKIGNDGIDYNDLDPDLERKIFLDQVSLYTQSQNKAWENETLAKEKYKKHKTYDPYIDIQPALLNSADIIKYVWTTGMICPFFPERLKGASYEVSLKGKVIYWDQNEIKRTVYLENPDDSFELEPNSIAFVTLEPFFQIPDYIALRFNLKISHVYKGLLLGTGPLVDPGFQGRLSIPLHNLTTNTYRFYCGDGMIQMEFTKLSKNDVWLEPSDTPRDVPLIYRRTSIKPGRKVDDYLKKATEKNCSGSTVVRSAIPKVVSDITKKSDELQGQVDDFKSGTKEMETEFRRDIEKRLNHVQMINVATIVAIAALVVSLLGFTWNIISGIRDDSKSEYKQLEEKYYTLEEKYNQIRGGDSDGNN